MRRKTRSQTAAQRQPAQPIVVQPVISEEQRAHALNNVVEIRSNQSKEEVQEEVTAPIQIAAQQEPEEEKKERRSQLSQGSRAISKMTDCPRCGKHFSRKDNLQRHMRKVNCNSTKGSQRGGGGAVSEAISIKDDSISAVSSQYPFQSL